MEESATLTIHPFIGVRSKIVPLSLEEVLWKASAAIAVIISKGRRKGRGGNTIFNGVCNYFAPVGLGTGYRFNKIRVEQEVGQLWIAVIGFRYFLQKRSSDDATPSPNLSDFTEIQFPPVFFLRFSHKLEPLGIGTNFGAIEGISNGFDKGLFIYVR